MSPIDNPLDAPRKREPSPAASAHNKPTHQLSDEVLDGIAGGVLDPDSGEARISRLIRNGGGDCSQITEAPWIG